jgi:tRNA (mo5U34)-methyltransferase
MDELHTGATSSHWTRSQIESRVRDLGEWFHNMNLQGVQTAPNHFLGDYPSVKWSRFSHAIPGDLQGKSVLDIGCNAGFYSLEMKRRGAERVVGIDSDSRYLEQAAFAAEVSQLEIEFRRLSVYDVAQLDEQFDVVLFLGVLYHLRHPLLALDILRQHVVRDLLVVQSMLRGTRQIAQVDPDYPFEEAAIFEQRGFPKMYFIENKYSGDETNWWIPNNACLEAMLRSAGFQILGHPEAEIYTCSPSASEIHPPPIPHTANGDSKATIPQLPAWEATA